DRPPEVGVAVPVAAGTADPSGRRPARLPWPAPDRLTLARLDGTNVEEPVRAVRGLQSAAGDQRPDGPSRRKGIGKPELAPDLGGRLAEDVSDLHTRCHGGEERVCPA